MMDKTKLTRQDLIEHVMQWWKAQETISAQEAMVFINCLGAEIDAVLENEKNRDKELVTLTQEQYKDTNLHAAASDYGLTANQAQGILMMANQFNDELEGTGVICVPYWFHKQFEAIREQNKQYANSTEELMKTMEHVTHKLSDSEKLNINNLLHKRSNIITGTQTPYIPGVSGPRLGDEHLDRDNIYNQAENLKREYKR